MSKEKLISLLPSVFKPAQTQDIDLYTLIDKIMAGEWREPIEKLRAMKPEIYKKKKAQLLPAVTISGRFTEAKLEGLVEHSGFICIDIDGLDDELDEVFSRLTTDPYIHFLARSASGKGLFGFVKIPAEREKHKDIAQNLIKYFADTHDVILDKQCIDIPRKRFVSWDPAAFLNPDSKQFRKTAKPKPAPSLPVIYTNSDIDHILDQILLRRINLADDYHDWYRLGWALLDGLPEGKARDVFHQLSSYSNKYEPKAADRKFNQLKKDRPKDVTLGTFFYMAKQAGCEVQQPQTKVIFRSAAFSKKNQVSQKAAVEKAKLFAPDADEADIKQVVQQVFESKVGIEDDKETPIITLLQQFIAQQYQVRYNEVKNRVEIDGKVITDRIANSIYIAASDMLGDKVKKSDIDAILNSGNAPSYHPIKEWFEANAHRQPEGVIDALFNTIKTDTGVRTDTDFGIELPSGRRFPDKSFLQHFGRKYAISLIEAVYGIVPRFQLVLAGKQYSGKTSFFRDMLPKEFCADYFCEASMDGGKDIMIRMAEHWLMCNDEMGGKVQHKDEKRMKNIISTDKITERRPYARYDQQFDRLAVWAGTSNEDDLIFDHTGNSRIIPINVLDIDFEAYNAIDKADFIMEAYHAFMAGERSTMEPWELEWLQEESKPFSAVPLEVEMIEELYEKPNKDNADRTIQLSAGQMMIEINEDAGSTIIRSSTMIGKWLKALGFTKNNPQRIDGRVTRTWNVVRRRTIKQHYSGGQVRW